MFRNLADRIILHGTRDAIETPHKSLRTFDYGGGRLEVWVERCACQSTDEAKLFVLKCGGSASRAERATNHPLDFWDDLPAEVWSFNYPGFGGSDGRARLNSLAPTARFAYQRIREAAAGRPVLVTGNSLGCTAAMHLAARYNSMAGLMLRNPPQLRQVIMARFGWKTLWTASFVAGQIPASLDTLLHAPAIHVPGLFFVSEKDRVVPPRIQQRVIDRYAGTKEVFRLPGAGHSTLLGQEHVEAYRAKLHWLRERLGLPATQIAKAPSEPKQAAG